MNRNIQKILVVAGAIFVLAGTLAADEQTGRKGNSAAKAEQAKLSPGDIETRSSRVYIFVDKTGLGHQHAIAGRIKKGSLQVNNTPAGAIVFDMTSFVADTLEARKYIGLPGETDEGTQRQVTANMLGADVLDTDNFPTATFTVKTLKLLESKSSDKNPQYELEGNFKLHGVSRKLKFLAEGTQKRGYLHLIGEFSFRQTDFGIQPYTKALGTIGVADKLTVYGDIWVAGENEIGQNSQKTDR